MELDIEKIITHHLEELELENLVREEAKKIIRPLLMEVVKNVMENEIQLLVRAEIHKILNSPINTDDGWGKKEHFVSFEDMFKKEFRSKLTQSYDFKREAERQVKERVDGLVKGKYNEIVEKIVDSLVPMANKSTNA